MLKRELLAAGVILALGVLFCAACEAVDVKTSQGAGADTFLNYWGKTANYGGTTFLAISKNYVPYIKFDLGVAGPNNISDANLTLYGTPNPSDPNALTSSFNVWGLMDGSDNWGEMTITYDNAPLVANPITWNPALVFLGTLDYTAFDEGPITMEKSGTAFVDFLNNRGPDGLVTLIIGSGNYSLYNFFSTKEDHGDASEAPFLSIIAVSPAVVERNNWTGTDSNSWSDPDNWLDETGGHSLPDGNAVVNLVTGSNYPVIIDSNLYAGKVFVQDGNLSILSGTLTITGGVLRIKDGLKINITDGQIVLPGNVEGQMWALIGKGKIITTKAGLYEVYAAYDSDTASTTVKPRKVVKKLVWGSSIVSAEGPVGEGGSPAQYCVDGSGMTGEVHAGFVDGSNSYYGRNLDIMLDPTLKFAFDRSYNLTDMYVWNYEDAYNGYALRQVRIEYSTDDITYSTLLSSDANDPNFFIFSQGRQDGTKNEVIPFDGVAAKYVKLTAVGGPGVGNYEVTFLSRYILRELQFCHEGMEASNPSPADNAIIDMSLNKLSWLPGNGAVTGQDVWLGTDPNAMTKIGDNISPDINFVDVSGFESGRRYYWRVDGLNSGGSTTTGFVWSFVTRAWLRWNPTGEGVVYAYGSPGVSGAAGENAANESGITGNLHAPFSYSNGWYCRKPWDLVPPIVEPQLYIEFDKAYDINEIWVWNHDGNTASESPIAMKTVKVEYSLDNVTYTTLMNGSEANFVLPHGNADGTHDKEIKFGAPAKYIKFTAIGGPGVGNYGSTLWGYKLRELRFYYDDVYIGPKANYPKPPEGQEVDIFVKLEWWPGDNTVTGQDIWLGKVGESMVKIASNISPDANSYTLPQLDNFSDYKWRIDGRNGETVTQGDEWHFSTHARLRWNLGLIGVVEANGSPGESGTDGYLAANESGLDYDLHASFQWSNGWYCRNPWNVGITEPVLKVTFDRIYDINEMWVWNHDVNTVSEAPMAMKTIKVEYSLDNVTYTTLMNGSESSFVLPHGDPNGLHDTTIGFKDFPAKYVKITAIGGPGIGNYGSSSSPGGYKLREVRFFYQVPLWADLNNDKKVDFKDYAIMAEGWLKENWIYEPIQYCLDKPAGDITGDCKVDYEDVDIMAGEWLEDIN